MGVSIEDGWLYIPASATGGLLNEVPLWFATMILVALIALVAAVIAAAMSNKRHGR